MEFCKLETIAKPRRPRLAMERQPYRRKLCQNAGFCNCPVGNFLFAEKAEI